MHQKPNGFFAKTPPVHHQGEVTTDLANNGYLISKNTETTSFTFVPFSAGGEPSPPPGKPPADPPSPITGTIISSEPTMFLMSQSLDSMHKLEIKELETPWLDEVYDPAVEGPLTLPLLEEIVKRKYYQEEGFTKLMVAAYVGDSDIVDQLIQEGENIASMDARGHSALWWAKRGWGGQLLVSSMKVRMRIASCIF